MFKFKLDIKLVLVGVIIFCLGGTFFLLLFDFFLEKKRQRLSSPDSIAENVDILVKALDKHRLLEGRLIGSSDYHPYSPPDKLLTRIASYQSKTMPNAIPSRSTSRGVDVYSTLVSSPEISNASININNTYLKTSSPESIHGLAVIDISKGNYDSAIKRLEKAVNLSPKNPKLLNELACSYLARAYDEDQPQDLIYALASITDAIEADPSNSLIEVRFNYAIMLEKLFLKTLARQAWQDYLKLDSKSQWAEEARAHIAILNEPTFADIWKKERENLEKAIAQEGENSQTAKQIARKYASPARVYVIEELLGNWGKAYLSSNKQLAAKQLSVARFIGNFLVDFHKDNLIHDMVATIDKYSSENKSEQLTELANAHINCKEGISLIDRSEASNAFTALDKALSSFTSLGDKASECLALLHLCRCYRGLSNFDLALKTSEQILNTAQANHYPYLVGRGWIQKANVYINLVDPKSSLEACSKAQLSLELISDDEDLVIVHVLFSLNFERLNNLEESFKHNYEAIKCFNSSQKPPNLAALLASFSNYTSLLNKPFVSTLFSTELIDLTHAQNDKTAEAAAIYLRSIAYHKKNNNLKAFEDLNHAKKLLDDISDKSFRERLAQEITLREGDLYLDQSPQKSIESYTKVADYFNNASDSYYKTHIYISRSRAYLAIGSTKEAETDLKEAIQEFEKERNNILEEANKISFFEDTVLAYEQMIELQLKSHNNIEEAFNYTERAKARVLLDTIAKLKKVSISSQKNFLDESESAPLTIKQIQKYLPENITIVEYKVLSDKIFIWIVQQKSINFAQVPINNKLDMLVKEYLNDISYNKPKEQLAQSSKPIYEYLIKPVKPFIDKEKTIVIIPDKGLNLVPFAALISPETGNYLIQEQALSLAPSATIFIHCLQKDLSLSNKDREQVLAIGNPTFNYKDFPGLHSLPSALHEAKQVALTYNNSLLFTEEKATKKVFLENAVNYDVIHFAGHALVNEMSNPFSLLVFAPDAKQNTTDTGALYAYEIYGYKFTKTRLVVLAACRTANGKEFQGEGVTSMARPFLASGVPSVIASLWNADDDASEKLFTTFHKERVKGKSSTEALRIAQIELINSDFRFQLPKAWAPFILIGSGTK